MGGLTVAILAILVVLGGCATQGADQQDTVVGETETSTYWRTDPALALEKIYETNTVQEVYTADEEILRERFLLDVSLLTEYHVRYTSGRYGLAEVFILRPAQGQTAKIREQLEQVRLSRLQEAEQYDVGGALEVAQKSVVFEQGEYVILLMVEDMEGARLVLDYYIPRM